VADRLLREMERCGAAVLDRADTARLSAYVFPDGRLNVDVVGRSASWIAQQAGLRAGPRTTVLLGSFDVAVPEEPMTHEKLSPVLGVLRVPDAQRGIEAARAVVRIAGAGHSAAIHSTDPETIMAYAATVPVLRVAVNVGNSTGSSGLDTNLAPTMTIGTGFVGRSSLGENLHPRHLVNWTKIAYNADASVPMGDFAGLNPWRDQTGPVPGYPVASNDRSATAAPGRALRTERVVDAVQSRGARHNGDDAAFRAEIRRLVLEELSQLRKG
jgi:hypothetical protein